MNRKNCLSCNIKTDYVNKYYLIFKIILLCHWCHKSKKLETPLIQLLTQAKSK